jgi:chromosome segregation ATPase
MSTKNQLQDNLDSLLEKVSRHDERIMSLADEKDNIFNEIEQIKTEFSNLKLNLESYKLKVENIHGFWEKLFDGGWKIALMVLGALILYMLKLQSPPS